MKTVLVILLLGTAAKFFANCENGDPCRGLGSQYEKEVSQDLQELEATDAALHTDIETLKIMFTNANGDLQTAYGDLKTSVAAKDAAYEEFQKYVENLTETVAATVDANMDLQKTIGNLTETIAAKDEKIHDLQHAFDDLNTTVSSKDESIKTMEKTIEDLKTSAYERASGVGATYVRWGKTECPSVDRTVKIYDGFAAGGNSQEHGGGSEVLCVPSEPRYANHTGQGGSAALYSASYDIPKEQSIVLFGKELNDYDVPCVVCQSIGRPVSLRIPVQTDCYSGWITEYRGYLLTANEYAKKSSDFVCVDSDADVVPGTQGSDNSRSFLSTVGVACTSVAPWCPPYVHEREIPCVMCTK